MKKFSHHQKAFSLVELSVVILIIGILISVVSQGVDLLSAYKRTAAQKLTKTSRVSSVGGLVLWYETSLDESFSDSDEVDGVVVSQWGDVNPQNSIKLNAKAGQKTDSTQITYNIASGGTSANTSGPTYVENGINNLPTLRFTNNGTSAYRYLAVDKQMSNIPNDSMTLFLVMRYRSGAGFFVDRVCNIAGVPNSDCGSTPLRGNPLFELHVQSDGSLSPYVRSNTGNFPSIATAGWDSGYNLLSGKDYVLTLQRDYGGSFTLYVNGNSTYSVGIPSKLDDGAAISLDPFKIGRHIITNDENTDFDMSEFIFFSGPMRVNSRKEIEDYLGKKYNIAITH